jgi:hypothetical protein
MPAIDAKKYGMPLGRALRRVLSFLLRLVQSLEN